MNEKEVLVRIVDVSNDYMIRAEYTSIPSEILKMYHYMKDKDGLYIKLDEDNCDSKYNDTNASVKEIEIIPGGNGWLNSINIYVEVL